MLGRDEVAAVKLCLLSSIALAEKNGHRLLLRAKILKKEKLKKVINTHKNNQREESKKTKNKLLSIDIVDYELSSVYTK